MATTPTRNSTGGRMRTGPEAPHAGSRPVPCRLDTPLAVDRREPLVDRILKEIVALKAERDRGAHSSERMRDLTVWYDEAGDELQRARTMARSAESHHGYG